MSPAITTVVKMMESLPAVAQERVSEYLHTYIVDLQDELLWDELFSRIEDKLIEGARAARNEIAAGLAEPLQFPDS